MLRAGLELKWSGGYRRKPMEGSVKDQERALERVEIGGYWGTVQSEC